LGIRITTVYSGLPAHPLFVHVPVILIPAAVIAALVFMARPDWLGRYGIALCLVAILNALRVVLVVLAIGAGLMTFRTGDLGAKAVWSGRLQAAQNGAPGGPGKVPPPSPGPLL
jgi:hypothetical protein